MPLFGSTMSARMSNDASKVQPTPPVSITDDTGIASWLPPTIQRPNEFGPKPVDSLRNVAPSHGIAVAVRTIGPAAALQPLPYGLTTGGHVVCRRAKCSAT